MPPTAGLSGGRPPAGGFGLGSGGAAGLGRRGGPPRLLLALRAALRVRTT